MDTPLEAVQRRLRLLPPHERSDLFLAGHAAAVARLTVADAMPSKLAAEPASEDACEWYAGWYVGYYTSTGYTGTSSFRFWSKDDRLTYLTARVFAYAHGKYDEGWDGLMECHTGKQVARVLVAATPDEHTAPGQWVEDMRPCDAVAVVRAELVPWG